MIFFFKVRKVINIIGFPACSTMSVGLNGRSKTPKKVVGGSFVDRTGF
jgi:hypothetical protein